MASDQNEKNGMTRRDFTSRLGAATAGLVVGGEMFSGRAEAAPVVGSRILGANDRVVVASIGVRGQGNSLKRGFARLKNVDIKTLCDIDANLADERVNDTRLKDVASYKPTFVQDMRRVFDDKDIDAVVIATPRRSGRCRPASTSTSRSLRRTRCGKAARWSKRPTASARSCRSAP